MAFNTSPLVDVHRHFRMVASLEPHSVKNREPYIFLMPWLQTCSVNI